jgi:cytochrome oxidase Cu insertion factor (SCO1/SenC/PrrC family)
MTRRRKILWFALVLVLVLTGAAAWILHVPKPQIASAEGQLAPDFTLNDQNGRPFHLADLRGNRVLLIFYRGYW